MPAHTIEFNVPDMTCGHCVSAVTKAIKAEDPHATVAVSLADKRVTVETTEAREVLVASLTEAGYTPA